MSTKRLKILGLLFCLSLSLCFVSMQSHASPPQWQQAGDDEEDEKSPVDAGSQDVDAGSQDVAPEPKEQHAEAESKEVESKEAESKDGGETDTASKARKQVEKAEERTSLHDGGDATSSPEEASLNEKIIQERMTTELSPPEFGPNERETPPTGALPRTTIPRTLSPTNGAEITAPFVDDMKKPRWFSLERWESVWQIRILALVLVLLALSMGFLLLHLLFPFQALRFLGKLSVFTLFLSGIGVFGLLFWRLTTQQQWSLTVSFDGLLWFALCAIAFSFWQRRNFPEVYISHLCLLPILMGALLWAALHPLSVLPPQQGAFFAWGWGVGYFTLAGLAVAASWIIASGYLHFFAQRMRGIGYGLPPEEWPIFQQQSTRMMLFLYPFSTVSAFLFFAYSLSHHGKLWAGFAWGDGRAWTFWFTWLFFNAALLSMRLPLSLEVEGERWEAWHARRLPSFLLLMTALLSALLFVGAPQWIQWLRN